MSAYMVEDDTINKVIAFLVSPTNRDYARYILNEAGYPLDTKEQQTRLAVRMFVLNKMGVESRYGRGQAKEFRPLDFKYRATMPPTAIQAHKALSCFLYQCSEGNVPETKLFKALEHVKAAIANSIVSNLPAYENAKWG